MEIIPAIDLINGKCVRLSGGDYRQMTVYFDDPLDAALLFEDAGIKRVHMVDLEGAKEGYPMQLNVLERIASKTKLHIDFGGGLKSSQSVSDAFNAGARYVNIGSAAVKTPELFAQWLDDFGSQTIILGADCKDKLVAIGGWLESTQLEIISFLREKLELGITQAFVTDISKDGLLKGPSFELYAEIQQELPNLFLIASGGVSSKKDLDQLAEQGLAAVIVGKAFYEGHITIKQLAEYAH